MEIADQVRDLVEGSLSARSIELVDVEHAPGFLRVTIDRDGGVDLDTVTEASESISSLLDTADVIPERYTLEVSSPGVERPLRTPAHFQKFVGEQVSVKTSAAYESENVKQRRFTGELQSADDAKITVDGREIPYDKIERARIVIDWSNELKNADKPTTVKGKS